MNAESPIAPIYCLWCGEKIPDSRRGSGHPPKTCSESCRKKRASSRESLRYRRVKNTPAWKDVRADYLGRLKLRLAEDETFARIFRAHAAARTKEWAARLAESDPSRHAQINAAKREERAAWRAALVADPHAWEAHKAKARAWYAGLSAAERERIFYRPRRKT